MLAKSGLWLSIFSADLFWRENKVYISFFFFSLQICSAIYIMSRLLAISLLLCPFKASVTRARNTRLSYTTLHAHGRNYRGTSSRLGSRAAPSCWQEARNGWGAPWASGLQGEAFREAAPPAAPVVCRAGNSWAKGKVGAALRWASASRWELPVLWQPAPLCCQGTEPTAVTQAAHHLHPAAPLTNIHLSVFISACLAPVTEYPKSRGNHLSWLLFLCISKWKLLFFISLSADCSNHGFSLIVRPWSWLGPLALPECKVPYVLVRTTTA